MNRNDTPSHPFPATGRESPRATFVLVHGAHHGGWCWRDVARALGQRGHAVSTPTQTGLGERRHLLSPELSLETFVRDIVNHIEYKDLTDVVLVGHSFGGLSVTGAADRIAQRIRHVVYLDALIAADGQRPLDVLTPQAAAARCEGVRDAAMPVPPVAAFGIPEDHPHAGWVRAHLSPHPFGAYTSRLALAHPPGNGLPCTYVMSTRPVYPALERVRDWVRRERPEWGWRDIATGHDSMITAPEELVRILASLV